MRDQRLVSVARGAVHNRYTSQVVTEMKAVAGDRLVIRSRHLDEPVRTGEIVEVHGKDGAPPYVVRWEGETDTVVIIPGPDAHVEHHTGGISSAQKTQT
jgi:hypothetical protein